MAKRSCLVLLSFLIILSFSVARIHGSKQAQALGNFQMSKFKGSSLIDQSHFEAEEILYNAEAHLQEGLKEKDRIEKLPGQPSVKFSQYGGYVTVDKSAGRAFYYYFVEAQHSKDTSPLLLWLNGGKLKI
ncbi:hypothetical protein L6164_017923 [Bauhinia variegata]|uniref:Uncharacterized protein n=1 Tax=Bauhinia variegata TaxID=167791 RepID=A0ACB9N9E1_BAUVA|nr:hypothetical protein L6164_017923 [Bauhinia variegata]